MELIVGKQNTLAYTFTVATVSGVLTGTLVVSGEQEWDIGMNDLNRAIDTTNSNAKIVLTPNSTFSFALAAGLKTWTWVIPNVPAGSSTSDTLLVYLNINPQQAQIALLQYQKA